MGRIKAKYPNPVVTTVRNYKKLPPVAYGGRE